MILQDLHLHTDFCDGSVSPRKMLEDAAKRGFTRVGLLAHSFVPFDSCCISPERVAEFQREVALLREEYRGRIEVLCGLELDLRSPQSAEGFDYTIGSVHYLCRGGEVFSIDDTPEKLLSAVERLYNGDFYQLSEDYLSEVSRLTENHLTIIGHFDLLKKFRRYLPFDDNDERYVNAWQKAVDTLLTLKIPFEINTGGIHRGWIDEPYPSPRIAEHIKAHGGTLILSSDAHRPEDIGFQFEKWEYLTK